MTYKTVDPEGVRDAAIRAKEDFDRIAKEFDGESERHIVILGAAKLDDCLLRLLKGRLLLSPKADDTIFTSQGGALSTFSARSEMAYRLGLISKSFYDALNGIRKIRNDFAHEVDTSLARGGHEPRIRNLIESVKDSPAYEWLTRKYFSGQDTPRRQLQALLSILILRLSGAALRIERISSPQPYEILPKNWEAAKAMGTAVQLAEVNTQSESSA